MPGPYIYRGGDFSQRTAFIGVNHECVALVRALSGAPQHEQWDEGTKLLNAPSLIGIQTGTAIATFVKGKYQSLQHDNHAAVFVRALPDGKGYVVFDQWRKGSHYPQQRTLYFNRPSQSLSDKAEAFSVIK